MAENKALLEFIAEAEELTENIEKKLLELRDIILTGGESPDIINSLFRDFHSLKGISGMFGFSNLSKLAHQLESFLDKIRLGKVDLDDNIIELLLSGKEIMLEIISQISNSNNDNYDISDFLENISIIFTKQDQNIPTTNKVSPQPINELLQVLTEYEEHRFQENIRKGKKIFAIKFVFTLEEFDERLNEITNILKTKGEVISTLPKPSDTPGKINFTIIYATDSKEEDIPIKDKYEYEINSLTEESNISVSPSFTKKEPIQQEPQQTQLKSISNTVRVDITKLDYVMNIVGELVTQKSELARLIENAKKYINNEDLALNLTKVTNSIEKKINELQDSVMSVRMVPLSQLFDKLERNLKKIAHDLGKEVKVVINGGDTELDKFIMEELSDPLMHIIRNSIDHGIESAEERTSLGKPPYGQIWFKAYQKGNYVFIEVSDDGRGIDVEKIRKKLIELKKLSPEQEVTDEYLLQTIFTPGFSTKENATELSGRGVGLDVVKNNLAKLRGYVDVKTELGKGTTFILTLPLTLIIVRAIILKTSGHLFALPINAVDEVVEITKNDVMKISGEEVVNLRNTPLPIFYLENIFEFASTPEDFRYMIVLKIGEKKAGMIVSEILGHGDIVIKSMGKFIKVNGIAGATQIGRGKTILVLDPSGLLGEVAKV
ncbi:MAG: chemotaxis protein CheA [Proteobacteria bacterium]|nr:chemotaxis protein CheA [Pseudomonadota bacterium]